MASQHRDQRTGRYARRPVPDVDVESRFDPMADAIEDIEDVSGEASPGTVEQPSYAPAADDLAQGGQRSPLRARRPEMVSAQDADHTVYGRQGAVTRAAVRFHGIDGMLGHVLGVEPATAPSEDVPGTESVRG